MWFFKILFSSAFITLICSYITGPLQAQQNPEKLNKNVQIVDSWHYSHAFGEIRKFRAFLPTGYSTDSNERYPVIYFFMGGPSAILVLLGMIILIMIREMTMVVITS